MYSRDPRRPINRDSYWIGFPGQRHVDPTERSKWTPGRNFFIYFGVILVYLTLISIVVILIILMLPKSKTESHTLLTPSTTAKKPSVLEDGRKGVYAIDPRKRLDLPSIKEESTTVQFQRTNSKYLHVEQF